MLCKKGNNKELTATVKSTSTKSFSKNPPHPLNTIELLKKASRYFRMSSHYTMEVAQSLYQSGFISYPRTETDEFLSNIDLHEIVREHHVDPEWGEYARRLTNCNTLWRDPSSGGHNDNAHPPIHPTKFSTGKSAWGRDHQNLYGLVVRHFLACVSKPAEGAETTVVIDFADELFSASGREIRERSFLDVYGYEVCRDELIPDYSFNQQFTPTRFALVEGATKPPPLLSEEDLLSCMEMGGIGTDATMHEHINTVLLRGYAATDPDSRFKPTSLGEALVLGYDQLGNNLWKPNLRAHMEQNMALIAKGFKTKDEVLETSKAELKTCFLEARSNQEKLLQAIGMFFERSGTKEPHMAGEVVQQCTECKENMVLKKTPNGSFMVGCLGFPKCRNAVWLPRAVLEATVTTDICQLCQPGPVYLIQFELQHMEKKAFHRSKHLGCIGGCDKFLRRVGNFCGTGPHLKGWAR